MIYLEELNISIIIKLFKIIYQKKYFKKIYFIYPKKTDYLFIIFCKFFLRISLIKLKFKMMDIKHEKTEEIIREIIPREDLYICEDKLKNKYFNQSNNLKANFFLKSIIGKSTHLRESFFRLIFLVSAIEYIEKKNSNEKILIINNKSWITIFINYSINKNIIIQQTKLNFSIRNLYYFFNLTFFKNKIKDIIQNSKINYLNNNIKLFCEGKNQPYLNLNGERSDFSWLIHSNFKYYNTAYNCLNKNDVKKLRNFKIYTTFNFERKTFKY